MHIQKHLANEIPTVQDNIIQGVTGILQHFALS